MTRILIAPIITAALLVGASHVTSAASLLPTSDVGLPSVSVTAAAHPMRALTVATSKDTAASSATGGIRMGCAVSVLVAMPALLSAPPLWSGPLQPQCRRP
jgi:hypothetical protein